MACSTSRATMRPCGPDPETRDRSMPRSPASRRASGVTDVPPASLPGPKLRSGVRTSRKGSIGAVRGAGAACATACAGTDAGRAVAAGADGTLAGAGVAGGLCAAPGPEITAITAPTFATSPTLKWISVSVPAVVDGTSIEVLSVSISKRLSPGFTASPAALNHFVILPSATVSPSCGIRTSTVLPSRFCCLPLPAHRHILRLEKFLHALLRAFAAEPRLLRAAERRRRIGDQAAIEADHAEIELLGHPHAAAQILCIEISNQAIFRIVGALDRLV